MRNAAMQWWRCPICATEHFVHDSELMIDGRGPCCSLCVLHGRVQILLRAGVLRRRNGMSRGRRARR